MSARPETVDAARRERAISSVRHLQNLYSTSVTISLGLAFERVVSSGASATAITLSVAFVATLIPFYHGSLRHLDETYVFGELNKRAAILPEFVVRFAESALFLGLAATIDRPVLFAWIYVALLVTNIAWSKLTELLCVDRAARRRSESIRWRRVNLAAALAVVLYLAALHGLGLVGDDSRALVIALPIFALARTAFDYLGSWRFYAAVDGDTAAGGKTPSIPYALSPLVA